MNLPACGRVTSRNSTSGSAAFSGWGRSRPRRCGDDVPRIGGASGRTATVRRIGNCRGRPHLVGVRRIPRQRHDRVEWPKRADVVRHRTGSRRTGSGGSRWRDCGRRDSEAETPVDSRAHSVERRPGDTSAATVHAVRSRPLRAPLVLPRRIDLPFSPTSNVLVILPRQPAV